MPKIRVISFNIKNSRSNEGTIFAWEHRKEKVVQIVNHYKPDIIGFQEVFIEQLEYLESQLSPEYTYRGVGRDDGVDEGEFCPIFYKGLSCLDSGTFWFSDTPEKCSNTWNMYLPRICTWIKFKNGLSFYNTHVDDRDPIAREKSFNLLIKRSLEICSDNRIILVGDLNCGHTDPEFKELNGRFENTYWRKNRSFFNRSASYHGFTGKKTSTFAFNGRRVIDHILVSKDFSIIDSRLCYHNVGGHSKSFPSDHWPILTDLEF